MGGTFPPAAVPRREVAVDIDAGERYAGQVLQLQLLAPGADGVPDVLALAQARSGEVTRVDVELRPHHRWVLARVADLHRRNRWPGPPGHPGNSYAVAYASPWYAADAGTG